MIDTTTELDDTGVQQVRLLDGAEIRTADEGTELALTGRLVPYDVWAPIGGLVEERHRPGVFAKSIEESARALPLKAEHEQRTLPIGKAVEWDDRPDGLWGRWIMAPTEQARTVHRMVAEGFMTGLSCGFLPLAGGSDYEQRTPPSMSRITRRQARLLEGSVVAVPTWSEAVVSVTRSRHGRPTTTPHADAWRAWRRTL